MANGPTKKEYLDLLKGHANGVGAQAWQKKSLDRDGMDPSKKDMNIPIHKEGINCDKLIEPIPNYHLSKAPCEKVIAGSNNSWIVLGRDRHTARLHNERNPHYGGQGHSNTGMIDIVVGRMATKVEEINPITKKPQPAHPVFFGTNQDAARIYISQKADIDRYFGLSSDDPEAESLYSGYEPSETKAAIGIKADAIRVIGREGVKIISSADIANSHGFPKKRIYGIELICANASRTDRTPVPIAKAPNVARALTRAIDLISKLNGIVDSFLMAQTQYNIALQSHTHFSPFFGAPTSPSVIAINSGIQTSIKLLGKAKTSLLAHKTMLGKYSGHYCQPFGKGWVGSRYNKTN